MSGGEDLKVPSVFDTKIIKEIYNEIREAYLGDDRPWIIGYSGGKDSTVALQLVWYALAELPKEKLKKDVFVISSNTLVESPVLLKRTFEMMSMINKASIEQNLPFRAEHITPNTKETFWVNIIGKGYPAPTKTFRWCTDRMKIKPADDFIMNKVSKFNEVLLVLGVRKAESITRAQIMSLRKIKGTILSRHSKYPQAYVYTPLEDFNLDDVWTYLLQVKNPWGTNNRDLLAMYTGDKSGECPLVVDKTTGSCGNSRFGCWTCTVVSRDKTMENLIENGEEWMKPMLELRDWLYTTTLPENKKEFREFKGRRGNVRFKSDGSGIISRGPYKFFYSQFLLKKLLKAQKEIENKYPEQDFKLITHDELLEIRKLWISERNDWEDTLPKLYKDILGKKLNLNRDDSTSFSNKEKDILKNICKKYEVSENLIADLITVEKQHQGMTRRSSIYKKIDQVFRKEWRTEEEVIEEYLQEGKKNEI